MPVRLRDFIEVHAVTAREVEDHPPVASRGDEIGAPPVASLMEANVEPRWSLWGDAEA
jgi:hypothetical protein